jgi:hypothetical protein
MKDEQIALRVNAVCLAGLAGWAAFTLLNASSFPGRPFGGDYGVNILQSISVIEGHTYPFGFTYPLPCVLLRYYLFKLAGNFSGLIWCGAVAYSIYYVMRFAIKECYVGDERYKFIYALLSFIPVAYYVQHDIRLLNCNLIVLCLTLASILYMKRGKYFLSAFFLSCGVAIKLYPIFIVAYFLIRRQFRFTFYNLFWIVTLFVVIPVAVLGVPSFSELTGKWFESVSASRSPDFLVHLDAYRTSLHFAVLYLTSHGNVTALSARSLADINSLFSGLKVLIILSGLAYVLFDFRRTALPEGVDQNLLNAVVILLGSLLLSDLLQPHHGVFLLGASFLIMNFSLFTGFSKAVRYSVLAAALIPTAVLKTLPRGVGTALAMNLHILVYILILVFLRFYTADREERTQLRPACESV